MTPEEAYQKALEIAGETSPLDYAPEILAIEGENPAVHMELEKLLCDILREHGYTKLADFYQSLDFWYE